MICQDGFITSHAVQNIELLEDDEVKNFVGEYEPENYLLNPECPMAVGPYALYRLLYGSKAQPGRRYCKCKQSRIGGCKRIRRTLLEERMDCLKSIAWKMLRERLLSSDQQPALQRMLVRQIERKR